MGSDTQQAQEQIEGVYKKGLMNQVLVAILKTMNIQCKLNSASGFRDS